MAKKDEVFSVGDEVRILHKDGILGGHDLTNGKTYTVTAINKKGAIRIVDDERDGLYINKSELVHIEKLEASTIPSVKAGDKVRITGASSPKYYHAFDVGEIVTVLTVNETGIFAENSDDVRQSIMHGDFEPFVETLATPPKLTDAEKADIACEYFEALTDLEKIDFINQILASTSEGATEHRRPTVGDIVRVTSNKSGHSYMVGGTYKVTTDTRESIQPYNLDGRTGAPNWIGESEFEIVRYGKGAG